MQGAEERLALGKSPKPHGLQHPLKDLAEETAPRQCSDPPADRPLTDSAPHTVSPGGAASAC